jgi:hypothetical protein
MIKFIYYQVVDESKKMRVLDYIYLIKQIMKHKTTTIQLLLIMTFVLMACNDDKKGIPEGDLKEIGLEKKEIIVNNELSSFDISTKETAWWTTEVKEIIGEDEIVHANSYYIKEENGNIYKAARDTISGDWFEIIKVDPNILRVNLSSNNGGIDRTLIVILNGQLLQEEKLSISQMK